MMKNKAPRIVYLMAAVVAAGCATTGGSAGEVGSAEQAAMRAVGDKVSAKVVWSSARQGNHKLYVMNADGSGVEQITRGDNVDWFPRFSPDGTKIVFTRSKKGWVYERDANVENKWDVWTVSPDGAGETKVVDNASWASWLSTDEMVYVRGTKIFRRKLGQEEALVMDSAGVPDLEGALLQQPEMSRDGRFIAITLRGSKRETGIWNIEARKWTPTGLGCQVNWTPDGDAIYWVNPTGNGGSEVYRMPVRGGKPEKPGDESALKFMDLPGRRSHEYFPQLSSDGKWMVWAATQRGHDHDIADYEIYIWQVGSPAEQAARLTFHSANDRWPDIFIANAAAAAPPSSPVEAEPVAAGSEPASPAASPATATKRTRVRRR